MKLYSSDGLFLLIADVESVYVLTDTYPSHLYCSDNWITRGSPMFRLYTEL
jgi:hypothetical protein